MLDLKYKMYRMKEKLILWIVWKLPKTIIYWAAIRLMSFATCGQYGNDSPTDLPMMEALKRWPLPR
jgi:hypothetical protein